MSLRRHIRRGVAACCALLSYGALAQDALAQRQMEALGRGVVAIHDGTGDVFVGWRLLGTDPAGTAFNLYRRTGDGEPLRLNDRPLIGGTNFVDREPDITQPLAYTVRPVVDGEEGEPGTEYRLDPRQPYLVVPLQTPEGYTPNDLSVGDLDGDGEYEIVVHQVGRGRDNSQNGITTEPILEAYKLDGTFLWRIGLGKNIREGAHYTQFLVYDLDGNGRAEIVVKTADGSVDGGGQVIGDPNVDYRNENGHVLAGPEFLTVFDGATGAALATTEYIPPRHPVHRDPTPEQLAAVWGDGRGNRSERYLGAIAYLDGERPSVVMSRGYYERTVVAAWDYRDGELRHLWTFDSDDGTPGHRAYRGQGNHNLSVGDVTGDGRDEIMFGAAAIAADGAGLYSTGLGHGDAMHFSDLDPDRRGLEVFNIQERFGDAGANFRDARTGEVLWKVASVRAGSDGEGPGRASSFNVDPRHRGAESWVAGAGITGMWNAKGEKISESQPSTVNFAVWWDGDLTRELLDRNVIYKWNWREERTDTLLVLTGAASNNGTKATPGLSGDILGDWREEVIMRAADDPRELRIYTTTIPTEHRFYTFMHDPVYRLGIAWQNVGYNQPPHPGFYVGDDMEPQPPFRPRSGLVPDR